MSLRCPVCYYLKTHFTGRICDSCAVSYEERDGKIRHKYLSNANGTASGIKGSTMPVMPKKKIVRSTTSVTVRVDVDLVDAVKNEVNHQGITLTSAVEYGLRAFLEASKPTKDKAKHEETTSKEKGSQKER